MTETGWTDFEHAGMQPRSALFDGRLPVTDEGYACRDGWFDRRVLGDLLSFSMYTPGATDQPPVPLEFPPPMRGPHVRVLLPCRAIDGATASGRLVDVLASGDLHRQLARLPAAEAHIAEFANSYGLLGGTPGAEPAWAMGPDGEPVVAEPLTSWTREIGRLRVLCAFWDGRIEQATRQLDGLEPLNQPPSLVDFLVPRRTRLRDAWLGHAGRIEGSPDAARDEARQFVTGRVDAELNGTHLHLAAGPYGLRLRPDSLLAATYLSFALEIAAAQGGPVCLFCRRPLVDVERSTRRYCDGRCKNRAQRARSRLAQTLELDNDA
jgi:hypothetical protein